MVDNVRAVHQSSFTLHSIAIYHFNLIIRLCKLFRNLQEGLVYRKLA